MAKRISFFRLREMSGKVEMLNLSQPIVSKIQDSVATRTLAKAPRNTKAMHTAVEASFGSRFHSEFWRAETPVRDLSAANASFWRPLTRAARHGALSSWRALCAIAQG